MHLSGNSVVGSGDDIIFGRVGTGTLEMTGGLMHGGFTVVGKFGTGLWNQSGGLFDQDFGDFEIGDGGRPDQTGTAGPRIGTVNLSGGILQTADSMAIGNRNGTGVVNVSGGTLAATGTGNSSIYIGRGMDWDPGTGGPTELRVTGGESLIVANQDLMLKVVAGALQADFNADGDVDGGDYAAWATGFGTASGAAKASGDSNGEGDVDGGDFLRWQAEFGLGGATGAAIQAVPEPSALSILNFRVRDDASHCRSKGCVVSNPNA